MSISAWWSRDGRGRRPRRRPQARPAAARGALLRAWRPWNIGLRRRVRSRQTGGNPGTPRRDPPKYRRSAAAFLFSGLLSRWRPGLTGERQQRIAGDCHGIASRRHHASRRIFGPVLDDLATGAERVFYAELANGRRTRDAVRVARAEMRRAQASIGRSLPRDAGDGSSNGPMAFAWAQMVLYHHGPDYPLGTSIEGAGSVAMETTERRAEAAFPNSRTRVLKAGFVGRRKEMHALRADLRQGRHLHVVQGTGGLGKSAFCTEALKVYDRLGWQPFGVWCIDVEGAPNPVAGLVSHIESAGNALCGDKWPGVLAAYEQAASQDEGRRSSSGHLLFLLQGTPRRTAAEIGALSRQSRIFCRPGRGRPTAEILPSGAIANAPACGKGCWRFRESPPAGSRCWPRVVTGTPTSARWSRSTACRRTRYGGCCCGFRICGGCRRTAGGGS